MRITEHPISKFDTSLIDLTFGLAKNSLGAKIPFPENCELESFTSCNILLDGIFWSSSDPLHFDDVLCSVQWLRFLCQREVSSSSVVF